MLLALAFRTAVAHRRRIALVGLVVPHPVCIVDAGHASLAAATQRRHEVVLLLSVDLLAMGLRISTSSTPVRCHNSRLDPRKAHSTTSLHAARST